MTKFRDHKNYKTHGSKWRWNSDKWNKTFAKWNKVIVITKKFSSISEAIKIIVKFDKPTFLQFPCGFHHRFQLISLKRRHFHRLLLELEMSLEQVHFFYVKATLVILKNVKKWILEPLEIVKRICTCTLYVDYGDLIKVEFCEVSKGSGI